MTATKRDRLLAAGCLFLGGVVAGSAGWLAVGGAVVAIIGVALMWVSE